MFLVCGRHSRIPAHGIAHSCGSAWSARATTCLRPATAPRRSSSRFATGPSTLVYLRGYAGLAGRLPHSSDGLVDEVFGELLDTLPTAA